MGAAHFEYRIWQRAADEVREAVAERGQQAGEKTTVDVYLLVPGDPSIGIKIRSGRLEVKRRLEVRDGLERWKQVHSSGFPLPGGAALGEILGVRLGSGRPITSSEDLLQAARSARPPLRVARVLKHRIFYDVEGCRADVDRVQAGEQAWTSVGLDHTNADGLQATVRLLGAGRYRNVAYPEMLLSAQVGQ